MIIPFLCMTKSLCAHCDFFFLYLCPTSSTLYLSPSIKFCSLKENTGYDKQPKMENEKEMQVNNSRQNWTDEKTKREIGGRDLRQDKMMSVVKTNTQPQAMATSHECDKLK